MGYKREELNALQEQTLQKQLLEARLLEERETLELARAMLSRLEQEKDEKKEALGAMAQNSVNVKRYREAYEAARDAEQSYKACFERVSELREAYKALEREYRQLDECEERLECAIEEKKVAIKRLALPIANAIEEHENEIAYWKRRKEIIHSVISECNQALGVMRRMNDVLLEPRRAEIGSYYDGRLSRVRKMVDGLHVSLMRCEEKWMAVCKKTAPEDMPAQYKCLNSAYFASLSSYTSSFHGILSCKRKLKKSSTKIYEVISACEGLLAKADQNIRSLWDQIRSMVFDAELEEG